MRREQLHFTVTGEFLTQHARQLWADEHRHKRAIDLLLTGLMGVRIDQVLDILTGKTKLVGDSAEGIEIVEDGVTLSPCGQPLPTLTEAFERVQRKAETAERDARELIALEAGEGTTIASPHGLVLVSKRTRDELGKGEIKWEDVRIFRVLQPLQPEPIAPHKEVLRYEELVEPEPRRPPPVSHPTIVTDTGWLSPEGRFYPCGWREHIHLAGRISRSEDHPENEPAVGGWEHRLEQRGWIKLAGRDGIFAGDHPATERQNKKILEWCLGEGKGQTKLPYWLEPGWED